MTLNEIAYNLLNLIRGGKTSHDENISLEQIKFNIRHYRAVLIRRDYARNGLVTRHLEQSLGCLELEKVDGSQCCGLDIGCEVYKTKMPVPKTVRFNFEDAITFVGAADGLTRIPLVSSSVIKFLQYDKYTYDNKKAYMIDDYLYIFHAEGMEYVNIRGVFENPEDLAKYECNDQNCYDEDSEYPIPADMIQAINSGFMNGELRMVGITVTDTTNDRDTGSQQIPASPTKKSEESR